MATHAEALLISSILRTGDHHTALNKGTAGTMFHVYVDEWAWIERYITRHKRCPSKTAFKAKFEDFPMRAVDDVEHYVDEVKKEHARFLLSSAIDQAISFMDADQMEEATKALHGDLIKITSHMDGDTGELDLINDWEVMFAEAASRVDQKKKTGLSGLPTGFPTLDNLTGGPQGGDLWIMAARLGQGKTWSLVRMGAACIYAHKVVQYDALEQNARQVGLRFHTFFSSKYGREVFKSLDLTKGENYDLLKYKRFLQSLPDEKNIGRMFISDQGRGRVTPLTIAAQIERNHPDIVFLDYITLMVDGERDWQRIAKLSGDLKVLASRYEVPIVAAAQINRSGDGKEPPKASHLTGSDAIGQDADAVITMAQQSQNVMKMRLAKFRNGQDGEMWFCKFTPNSGHYEEVSGDTAEQLMSDDMLEK